MIYFKGQTSASIFRSLKKCYQAWKLGRLEFPEMEFFVWNWIEIIINQALWGNYLKNGVSEYISIQVTQPTHSKVSRFCENQVEYKIYFSMKWMTPSQAQDFDVPSSVLSHLVHAGIVKIHPR